MSSDTDPPTESERHMAFPIRFFWAWQQFTIVARVPFRLKLIDIVTEYGPVVITMPYIGYACRAFWNEHALIPVIFCRSVRQTESDSGSPAKNVSDDCAHLRKAWSVGICRETRTTDHAIKLSLCLRCTSGKATIASVHYISVVDVVSNPAPLLRIVITHVN